MNCSTPGLPVHHQLHHQPCPSPNPCDISVLAKPRQWVSETWLPHKQSGGGNGVLARTNGIMHVKCIQSERLVRSPSEAEGEIYMWAAGWPQEDEDGLSSGFMPPPPHLPRPHLQSINYAPAACHISALHEAVSSLHNIIPILWMRNWRHPELKPPAHSKSF